MFARTRRLTLRPAWPEDAVALAETFADAAVVRMLARVPLPYTLADANSFVAQARGPHEPRFVMIAHDRARPELIGGVGIRDHGTGPELAYWLKPDRWGLGYATEAGAAVIDMARHALPLRRLGAWHFTDNPASGRVLHKLGFRDTGRREPRHSLARGGTAEAAILDLDLEDDRQIAMRIAA